MRLRMGLVAVVGLLGALGLTLSRAADPAKTPEVPKETRIEKDLAYADGGPRNTLDLFVPPGEGPFPLVVWVHGGGWKDGSKAGGPGPFLLQRGFAVASINYRLSQHAKWPAQIHDCKAAVRFLRANAKKYNLDPERFAAWGASAGGHLVTLLGTTLGSKDLEGDGPNKDTSSKVHCVINWFGPSDLGRLHTEVPLVRGMIEALVDGKPEEKKEATASASPLTHVSKAAVPLLIVHGDKDPIVPINQAEILAEACKKCGAECTLKVIKDGSHGGPGFLTEEVIKLHEDFLRKNLKVPSKP